MNHEREQQEILEISVRLMIAALQNAGRINSYEYQEIARSCSNAAKELIRQSKNNY